MKAQLDEYGYFSGVPYRTFTEWFRSQKERLPQLLKDGAELPENTVTFYVSEKGRYERRVATGNISFDGNRLSVTDKSKGKSVTYTLTKLNMCGRNLLVCTDENGVRGTIRGNKRFCACLYLDLFSLENGDK